MELEKKLNILYQKQGRATQFSDKANRDKWLRKEIKDLMRVLDSTMGQVSLHYFIWKLCQIFCSITFEYLYYV